MTGSLSSLLVDETGWISDSTLALAATVLLLAWWLGVILRSLRAHDDAEEARPSRPSQPSQPFQH